MGHIDWRTRDWRTRAAALGVHVTTLADGIHAVTCAACPQARETRDLDYAIELASSHAKFHAGSVSGLLPRKPCWS